MKTENKNINQAEVSLVQTNDIENFYLEKGMGKPLILLHGNGEDHTYFKHQIEYFSKSRRVIAVDTRGHGKTPRGSAPFTIRQFADDLYFFMQSQEIEKADILGFSDGGNIALCFAMKYPQMVNRLIANGANLDPSGVKVKFQFPIELGYRIASVFAKKKHNAEKNSEMLGLMVNDPNISPMELGKISAPTLIIAGTNDLIKRSHTELIAVSIPNAKLALIEGDHFVAGKNPDEFNATVEAFLNSSNRV